MIDRTLSRIYLKICISKQYSDLQVFDELTLRQNKHEWLSKIKTFYSNLRSLSEIPAVKKNIAYPQLVKLFPKIEESIDEEDTERFMSLSKEIKFLLDELYEKTSAFGKDFIIRRYSIGIIAGIFLALLLIVFYSSLKKRYLHETEQYDLLVNEDAYKHKILSDILALKEAIQKFHDDNGSYPKSSGGWDAVNALFGESRKDWIPGLTPRYIEELPTDPRKSQDPNKQYMYKSDGDEFKLIAHFPVGMDEISKTHPELIDARRPSWAFGVWSDGAKNW